MGRGSRHKPKRLPEKLLQIRASLGLSQNGMVRRLGLTGELSQEYISGFERGVREPSFTVVLQYARVAGVWMDVLVDDELDLPAKLPSVPKHQGINKNPAPKRILKER
jgi:transcriptional regulator with XRE-family HTH domain